jgi:hypothetical protein
LQPLVWIAEIWFSADQCSMYHSISAINRR